MSPVPRPAQETIGINANASRRARLMRKFAVIFAIVVVSLIVLRYSAMLVVADMPSTSAKVAIMADWGCGQCYRVVADRFKLGDVEEILLLAPESRRVAMVGAIPRSEQLCRQKLVADGVNSESIQVIDGVSRNDWDTARLINTWVGEHPDQHFNVLCDRFGSRRWSLILDQTLLKKVKSRVTVEGVVDPRYNDANWWRSRVGVKSYFRNAFHLAYARLHGEDRMPPIDWSPEKYESAALK